MPLSDFYPDLKGWTPVTGQNVQALPQIPTPEVQVSPFLRATLPLPMQYSGDTIKQYNRPGLSSFRIAPLPPGGIPSINSTVASTATPIIQKASQTTITEIAATDIESISVNNQSGTRYVVQSSDRNTLISFSNNAGGDIILSSPFGGKFIQSVANNTATNTVTVNITNQAADTIIVVAKIGSGSTTIPTISDTVGNTYNYVDGVFDGGNIPTRMWYAFNIGGGANAITVSLGGATFMFAQVYEFSGMPLTTSLDQHSVSSNFFVPPTITTTAVDTLAFSTTINGGSSITFTPGVGWTSRYSATNIIGESKTASLSGTFLTGDVVPSGGTGTTAAIIANFRTAAASIAGFPVGWFTYIENTGSGIFRVSSASTIDGSTSSVSIGPNQGALFVFDGQNWFTERGVSAQTFYQTVQQAGSSKPQEPRLNFLAPVTATDNPGNTSTDIAVPVFVGDSGAGGVAGLVPAPAAGDAAAGKLLGAGGTFVAPSPSVGGVLLKTENYTALPGDTGKLITFNTTGFTSETFIQEGHDFGFTSPTSLNVTPGSNVTNGHLIVVWAEAVLSGGSFATPTDTQGNTYTQVDTVTGGYGTLTMWYTLATATNSLTVTFTKSGGGTMTFVAAQVLEYSGNAASGNLDRHANNSSGSGTALTVNVSTTQVNDLILAAGIPASSQTLSAGAGYTQRAASYGAEDKNQATAATIAATMTMSGGSGWGIVVGAFKGASSGSNTYTLTLPSSAPSSTWMIFVQNYGAGTVTVDPNGRNLDGGTGTVSVASGKGIIIFTNGTDYYSSRGGS
jgi:hypothetical protein